MFLTGIKTDMEARGTKNQERRTKNQTLSTSTRSSNITESSTSSSLAIILMVMITICYIIRVPHHSGEFQLAHHQQLQYHKLHSQLQHE